MNYKKLSLFCMFIISIYLTAYEIKDGDSIAFLGDSITWQGWKKDTGYVKLCQNALKEKGLNVKIYPAGIGGNRSTHMLARIDKDIINKKPTFMILSCGVNDIWHNAKDGTLPFYKKNITEIVEKAQKANIKVVILSLTMIGEDSNNSNNQKAQKYNDFLRALAKEKNCAFVDLNSEMFKQVNDYRKKSGKINHHVTIDGVHMKPLGNRIMAQLILKEAFNIDI